MVIKTFDQYNLRMFENELKAAMEPILKEYGIVLGNTSGTYTEATFKKCFEFYLIAPTSGLTKTEAGSYSPATVKPIEIKALNELKRRGYVYGLTTDDFNKTFSHMGEKLVFVGLKSRHGNTPLIAKDPKTNKYYGIRERFAIVIHDAKVKK